MKKGILVLLLSAGAIFTSSNAFSGSSGWTTITHLIPYGTQLAFRTVYSSTVSTCDGGTRFMLDPSKSDYTTQAAVMTAAYLAKKKVYISFSDVSQCAPLITSFQVTD